MSSDVEVVQREREDTAVVMGRVPHGEVGPFIGQALGEVVEALGRARIAGPPFCKIDMSGDDFVLEVGFPVVEPIEATGRVVPSQLRAGEVATIVHTGAYDTVAPAYFALEEWITERGFVMGGPPWEVYLDAPDAPEPRTMVCWPFRRD